MQSKHSVNYINFHTWLFGLVFLGFLGGCKIHTGELMLPDHPKSISVPIIENKTFEYGVEERLTDILIQELIRDGRLQVVHRDKADLELDVTLIRYDLKVVSLNEQEQAVAFRLNTTALATLKDLRTGKILQENEKFKEEGVYFLSNQPQTRREEQIYTRLAEAMISRLLEGW